MLTTTRVFNTENPNLKMAHNEKIELGFDLRFNQKMRLSVTAYQENLFNGFSMGTLIENYHLIEYQTYKAAQNNPGAPPTLEKDALQKIFVRYNTPGNFLRTENSGVEFDMDFGRFHSIRTSFVLSGAYMRSSYWNTNHSFSEREKLNSLSYNVGVYESAKEVDERERFVTTLRITHNIPQIGAAITLTTQVVWKEKTWRHYNNDSTFVKYISEVDGKLYDWKPEMATNPEYAYMIPNYDPRRHIGDSHFPTIMFNINISKEIGKFLRASFYANNMFNSRPLYERPRYPGTFQRLNQRLYFGFELAITIK